MVGWLVAVEWLYTIKKADITAKGKAVISIRHPTLSEVNPLQTQGPSHSNINLNSKYPTKPNASCQYDLSDVHITNVVFSVCHQSILQVQIVCQGKMTPQWQNDSYSLMFGELKVEHKFKPL